MDLHISRKHVIKLQFLSMFVFKNTMKCGLVIVQLHFIEEKKENIEKMKIS